MRWFLANFKYKKPLSADMAIKYEELGLTKNESLAYEALVKHGKSPAAKISKESGVPHSRIYDTLASLENKGLVKVIPEKTKHFIATDPDNLLNLLAKKQNKLADMAEEIKELKKFYDIKVKDPVILAFGKKNFYAIRRETKPSTKINYRIKYASEPKPEFIKDTKKGIKKGVEYLDLVNTDKENIKNIKIWQKVQKNIKAIDNKGVAISVRDEEVLISLIKSNVTMLIRDTPFAEIMQKLVKTYYTQAKEIKL